MCVFVCICVCVCEQERRQDLPGSERLDLWLRNLVSANSIRAIQVAPNSMQEDPPILGEIDGY